MQMTPHQRQELRYHQRAIARARFLWAVVQVEAAELLIAAISLWYGHMLTTPGNEFTQVPFYRALVEAAPPSVWGGLWFVIGVGLLSGTLTGSARVRQPFLMASVMAWSVTAIVLINAPIQTSWSGTACVFAAFSMWLSWRITLAQTLNGGA